MKIEKIDSNHIKITVDSLDFDIFNIELSSLTPDSPQLHTFLFSMMQQAQHETGFNPYNGQILIEAVPGENPLRARARQICGWTNSRPADYN